MDSAVHADANSSRGDGSAGRGVESGQVHGMDILLLRLAQTAGLVLEESLHSSRAFSSHCEYSMLSLC